MLTCEEAQRRYAEIAEALRLDASTPENGCTSLIRAIADLKARLEIPATICEAGVSRFDFEAKVRHMAEVAFDDQCVGANPLVPVYL